MNLKNYCPNCFEASYTEGRCTICNYTSSPADISNSSLKIQSILQEKYFIGRVLGMGGFGITYLAFDLSTQQKCAIKEYFPSQISFRSNSNEVNVNGSNKDVYEYGLEGFFNEASVLSSFNKYEEIVLIFDFFKQNNTAYMVMEYVEGTNLKQYLNTFPNLPSINIAEEIFINIAIILNVVHSKNLLHRDISPENILIKQDGSIKIIDFGAARYFISEKSRSLSVVLKPGFAPVEQYSSNGVQGPWTDLYALGCTIYYFLTGVKVPDAMDRLSGEQPIDIKLIRGDINTAMQFCLEKCMKLNYLDRYSSVDELLDDYSILKDREKNKSYPNKKTSQINYSISDKLKEIFSKILNKKDKFYYIEFIGDVLSGEKIVFNTNKTINIGRSADCDIVISNNSSISRIHCEIRFEKRQKKLYIKDLSSNGTFLRSQRLAANSEQNFRLNEVIYLSDSACSIRIVNK